MRLRHFLLFALLVLLLGGPFVWYLRGLGEPVESATLPEAVREPLAGVELVVPALPGWWLLSANDRNLLAVVGAKEVATQDIDLCRQLVGKPGRGALIPIKGGHDWTAVKAGVARREAQGLPAHYELRNLLIDGGPSGWDIPAFEISGWPAGENQGLQLKLKSGRGQWVVSDTLSQPLRASTEPGATQVAFQKRLWLIWHDGEEKPAQATLLGNRALQMQRIRHGLCSLGGLRLRLYRLRAKPLPLEQAWPLYLLPEDAHGEDGLVVASLPSGRHQVADYARPAAEDKQLFEQALALGLVHLDPQGAIEVAPPDLERLWQTPASQHVAPQVLADWHPRRWDARLSKVNLALHYRLPGRFVRHQIDTYNQERLLSALRWRWANASGRRQAGSPQWRAWVNEQPVPLTQKQMPVRAAGLFLQPPVDWRPWQRVARWPLLADENTEVRYTLTLPKAARGTERMDLMVIGSTPPRVQGARVIQRQPRCLATSCKQQQAQGWYLLIDLDRGVRKISLSSRPLQGARKAPFYVDEQRFIARTQQGLQWLPAVHRKGRSRHPGLRIEDRDGQPLWEDEHILATAAQAGLGALLGLNRYQESSLSGMLNRLAARGRGQVRARLTLDLRLQRQAQKVLEQALAQDVAGWKGKDPHARQRLAALTLIDADQGDILALAGSPKVDSASQWRDLAGFDAVHGASSPLWVQGLQHRGDNRSLPGSTFKLVSALLLESRAAHKPWLEKVLEGLPLDELNELGKERAMAFDVAAGCYPAFTTSQLCRWGNHPRKPGDRTPVINNFGTGPGHYETVSGEMAAHQDERYGLSQALRDSINSWFAWLFERQDGTLLERGDIPGLPDSRALAPGALDEVRPFLPLLRHLGLGEPRRLDAGLLPRDYPWRKRDVLNASPALFEPSYDRHNVRQMAIGLRAHVTPLDMALVSAAIATGEVVRPRLLLGLDGEKSEQQAHALGIRTDRIRQGMKRVPVDGTAKGVFSRKEWDDIRPGLYLKTGTAPVKSGKTSSNNAWLTGWLEPGSLPGQKKRWAFACTVTHVRGTGGKVCGQILAQLFRAMKTDTGDEQKPQELGL